jgi:hypothetical protein
MWAWADPVLSKIPKWSFLSNIGQNKAIRSSYLWFVIVPICARLIDAINGPFMIFGAIIATSIKLPFSWTCFFFAATFFSMANVIYQIWCPQIIKNYKTVNDFKNDGFTENKLLMIYSDLFLSQNMKRNVHEQNAAMQNFIYFCKTFCIVEDKNKSSYEDEIAKNKPNAAILFSIIKVTDLRQSRRLVL